MSVRTAFADSAIQADTHGQQISFEYILEKNPDWLFVIDRDAGIGRAVAVLFAREGAQVTIADINADGLAETAALIGPAAQAVPYDAEDHASCRALVAIAAEGGLDVLCNVAGMLKWGPTETYAVEDFERKATQDHDADLFTQ